MDAPNGDGQGAPCPLVSIILVLYNSAAYLEPCMASIAALRYEPFELVVIDNASKDDSARRARESARGAGLRCLVSRLGRNRGFACAANAGARLARGGLLFFLNPDTELYPDTLEELVAAAADPAVGVAGCKIYYPDRRTLQHTGGYIRDNGLTMHYGVDEEDRGQYDTVRDVAYVTGAAMAVRKDVWRELGAFDRGYFPAYFEETDLCLRVRRAGYRVVYVPGARVVHHEAVTTGKFTSRYYYLYHRNRIRFMLKNYSWGFLLDRALPFEERWLGMISPEEQAVPLNKAYLVNILRLPLTLAARARVERVLLRPRIEDTVSEL